MAYTPTTDFIFAAGGGYTPGTAFALTGDTSAAGLGGIALAGLSLTAANPRAVGNGAIKLVGASATLTNPRAVGIGQLALAGLSETEKTKVATGVGAMALAGLSLAAANPRAVGAGTLSLAGLSGVAHGLKPIADHWIATRYRAALTGAADGVADLELPLKSFQIRRDQYRVYVAAVVPGVDRLEAGIAVRPNGSLLIERIYRYADGRSESFVLIEAPFESLRTDAGAQAGVTGTLTGLAVGGAASHQTVSVYDPVYRAMDSDGSRRIRCRPDPRLRRGDTAVIGAETLTVASIVMMIDANSAVMEIGD